MIVRAISEGDLTASISIIARLETALYAITEAEKVAWLKDDRDDMTLMAEELRGLIRYHKDRIGVP